MFRRERIVNSKMKLLALRCKILLISISCWIFADNLLFYCVLELGCISNPLRNDKKSYFKKETQQKQILTVADYCLFNRNLYA